MPTLLDLWHAVRTLLRNPGFTFVAVVTLALGIGANTAIFTVVNAVLLKPLPYEGSERLVRVVMTQPAESTPGGAPRRVVVGFTAAETAMIGARSRTLSHAGTTGLVLMGLSGRENAARLQGARMSASAFAMIGARPLLGRVFDRRDERPDADDSIILSHGTWQRHFGGAPDVVGQVVTGDSVLGPRRQTRYTVVGVMPAGFAFPIAGNEFWMPFRAAAPDGPVIRGPLLARLADGVSLDAAAAEILPMVREIRKGQRGNETAIYELVREHDELVAQVRPALLVLTIAVGLVLLIACINVANLLLARTAARRREIAIRLALGAGRARVIRYLLAESLVLAVAGGIGGVLVAFGAVRLLKGLATTAARFDLGVATEFPRLTEIVVDGPVLLFTLATAIGAGLLLGLLPALHHSREAMPNMRPMPVRSVLVVAEIAFAMVLLVGGSLLMRSFVTLAGVDTGYTADNVLTFQVALPYDQFPEARLQGYAEDLVRRLAAQPGVQAAGYANQLPLVRLRDTAGGIWTTADAARTLTPDGPDMRLVSRDYLEAMAIPVVRGRGFLDRDGAGQPRVLLINETLARSRFAGVDPIGQQVFVGRDTVPFQIVGIVGDVRQFGLDQEPEPQVFGEMRQWGNGMPVFPVGAYYVVRSRGDTPAVTTQLRVLARELEPQAALFNVTPMRELVATTIARPRMYAVLLATFAIVGVVLAVIGIYGLMAYSVAQRTREIGIRVALGAQRTAVLVLVLRQSLWLTAVGIGLGLAGAAGLSRYLEGMLFGLTPLDPGTFAAVAVLFALVAALAAFLPARRAARVDPIVALRDE